MTRGRVSSLRRDHPRSRGVYWTRRQLSRMDDGSSPLARGLLLWQALVIGAPRIIPARAGFTFLVCLVVFGCADHPRSRGVYSIFRAVVPGDGGSSPLARGLRSRGCPAASPGRIIPARAGFTTRLRRACSPGPDHPRSRGVYAGAGQCVLTQTGSSPLARGLPLGDTALRRRERIIPARAGFTFQSSAHSRSIGDHPRSRGVYVALHPEFVFREGSSPLARGLHIHWGGVDNDGGIIPARAGFTAAPTGSSRSRRDHPRSRGVYSCESPGFNVIPGSSPLARGLLRWEPEVH